MQEFKTHGLRSYNNGCRCEKCVRANTTKKQRDRERAKLKLVPNVEEQKSPAEPTVPAFQGAFERQVREMIAELAVEGAEAQLLADLMVFNARLLDAIPGNGRWHLANGAQKAIHECREQLHKLKAGAAAGKPTPDAGSDLEGFLNGLTQQQR